MAHAAKGLISNHDCDVLAGREEYLYAAAHTWNVSWPDGAQVYWFPTGQQEVHHADASLEIIFPDGAACVTNPAGVEVNGAVLSEKARMPRPGTPSALILAE